MKKKYLILLAIPLVLLSCGNIFNNEASVSFSGILHSNDGDSRATTTASVKSMTLWISDESVAFELNAESASNFYALYKGEYLTDKNIIVSTEQTVEEYFVENGSKIRKITTESNSMEVDVFVNVPRVFLLKVELDDHRVYYGINKKTITLEDSVVEIHLYETPASKANQVFES